VKDLGPVLVYLGVRFIHDPAHRILYLSQEAYIVNIMSKFGLLNCTPRRIPLESPIHEIIVMVLDPSALPGDMSDDEIKVLYQKIVGIITYIASTLHSNDTTVFVCAIMYTVFTILTSQTHSV
jgi:hypothetical protein